MNFLITGGTGFIGSALCAHLCQQRHHIVVKTRYPESLGLEMTGVTSLSEVSPDQRFDVVINLAGEPIANKRWSAVQKQKIVDSRLDTTEEIIAFLKNAKTKPAVLISGSAIGYYGTGATDAVIDEFGAGDDSFSSTLCAKWEASALAAEVLGIRTCLLRIGIVLGCGGGALQKMIPPFRLGLGGRIGTGTQWMSWIHLHDLIAIIDYCISDNSVHGPINCTAPQPVSNQDFTKALGKCLKRPAVLPVPSLAIKALMGEMGTELLLAGKQVRPVKLEAAGFKFKYKELGAALTSVL
ncbi:TIGR01777 family oxidoreductase [Zhongshania guokunii]|uniref:TIGR01777 family oxidoreductase n=1 Tax=Zhongshania guokunii TaxID=641783 RepID=A0ABV3U2Z2_9GAMM